MEKPLRSDEKRAPHRYVSPTSAGGAYIAVYVCDQICRRRPGATGVQRERCITQMEQSSGAARVGSKAKGAKCRIHRTVCMRPEPRAATARVTDIKSDPAPPRFWSIPARVRGWRIHCTVCMQPGPPPSDSRTGGSAQAIHQKCRIHKNQCMRHPMIISFPPARDHLNGKSASVILTARLRYRADDALLGNNPLGRERPNR